MQNEFLWGCQVEDYRDMFGLSENDLDGRILEYCCGPTAFNSQLHGMGHKVVSCDPLFSLSKNALETRFKEILEQLEVNKKELLARRRYGAQQFFSDYELGRQEQRYLTISEHNALPFEDFSFDLALCSHHLFVHSDSLFELARVAKEVRIYPIEAKGEILPLMGPILLNLQQANFGIEVRKVDCPIADASNAMLRIWAQACQVKV